MPKKNQIKKSILAWLDEQDKLDNDLVMKWDGGGDSGWVYFEINGEQVDNEYTEVLLNHMYNTLDYGSWAGEFQASGEAVYNHATRTFEGDDHYSEDDNDILEVDIKINVPKSLWFETLHVEVESNYDETPNVDVRFIVKNGFLTNEHRDFCSNLEEVLKEEFDAMFSQYHGTDTHEFRGCNDSWILERSEAKDENDILTFTITKVNINTLTSDERAIVLEIDEDIVESIDNSLNTK